MEFYLADGREKGLTIGFVPTMGALHEGHLSLVRRCLGENDICVVSIFVNPTQFNDPEDLKNYPRTGARDILLLEQCGCQVAFLPAVEDIYPDGPENTPTYSFGYLEEVYEGASRPGHFRGVGQVVARLLRMVAPDRLYLGEKDFQQLLVLQNLIRQLDLPVEVTGCPIVRERDGLAMSSRNVLLTPEQRQDALQIYHILDTVRSGYVEKSPRQWVHWALEALEQVPAFRHTDYFDIVDGHTLKPVTGWDESDHIRAIVAVKLDNVRLIDNMRIL